MNLLRMMISALVEEEVKASDFRIEFIWLAISCGEDVDRTEDIIKKFFLSEYALESIHYTRPNTVWETA